MHSRSARTRCDASRSPRRAGWVSALAILLVFGGPVCARAVEVIDPQLYLSATSFSWREYDDKGTRLLKESGPVYGVGGATGLDLYENRLLAHLKGEFFGSIVDYRGQTQTDFNNPRDPHSARPVLTDVTYFGGQYDADLGWRRPVGSFGIEPFAGAAFRWWLRDLHDSTSVGTDSVPFYVSGYTEYWRAAWVKAGVRADYRRSEDIDFYAVGGALYPFYVGNSVKYTDVGTVTFHPQGEWSGMGELGVRYRHLAGAIFYQGFRVSASPVVPVSGTPFLQPDSSSDLLGVRLGWAF